jgi:outer membrane lipoprotein-sorting protein
MMTAGGAAMAAALAMGAAVAAPAPKSLRFNMTTVIDAQGMHINTEAKIWVKGERARVETTDPRFGAPVLMLSDGRKIRTLYPQQKRGTVTAFPGDKSAAKNPLEFLVAKLDDVTHGAKKLGRQKLDGHTCDVYELTQNSPEGTKSIKSWIARDTRPRLPIKVERKVHEQRPNVTVNQTLTTLITGIRIGIPIPDSLFTVPPGYKIVEAGAPGGPVMPRMPGPGHHALGP